MSFLTPLFRPGFLKSIYALSEMAFWRCTRFAKPLTIYCLLFIVLFAISYTKDQEERKQLSLIAPKFKNEVGLYRDDGLAICKATAKEIEKNKQEVCQVFKSNGFKITIEANKKVVNFLDVTFNLAKGCYKPFMKPNNKLSYVHQQSNHPPALLKNIPLNINKRLSSISSSKEVFDESIAPYQKALTESGYDHKLTYNPPQEKALKNKRKRTRNITWYNPPFNSNVRTNLGRKFLHIVDKCFPKNHPLHKIFNRHANAPINVKPARGVGPKQWVGIWLALLSLG